MRNITLLVLLCLSFYSEEIRSQGISISGFVNGYSNGALITVDYLNDMGISGTESTILEMGSYYNIFLPVDPAIPGTYSLCTDICGDEQICVEGFWDANSTSVSQDIETCPPGVINLEGYLTNHTFANSVYFYDLTTGAGQFALLFEDSTFNLQIAVDPFSAGAGVVNWLECNGQNLYDTLYWDTPDTTFDMVLDACPFGLLDYTVIVSGYLQNQMAETEIEINTAWIDTTTTTDASGFYYMELQNIPESSGFLSVCHEQCTGADYCMALAWDEMNLTINHNLDFCPIQENETCSPYFEIVNDSLYNDPFNVFILFPGAPDASYLNWTFGDGGMSYDAYPSHIYETEGTYEICLYVSCLDGSGVNYCDSITINSDGTIDDGGMVQQVVNLQVVSSFTGISEEPTISHRLSVFPNPASDKTRLNWQSSKAMLTYVDVFNNQGKRIYSKLVPQIVGINTFDFDLSELSSGFYTIQIASGEEMFVGKVVVSNQD